MVETSRLIDGGRPIPGAGAGGPIRVLTFVGGLYTGGTESHIAHLLPRFDPRRVHVELMLLRAEGQLLPDFLKTGIPVHDLGYRHGAQGIHRAVLCIRRLVDRVQADIVHAYTYPCDVYAALALIGNRRVRLVTSRRGNVTTRRRRIAARLIGPFVDRVVSVSRATERLVQRREGLSPAKSVVIPNGIDVSRFPPRPAGPRRVRTIGTLGRLRRVKGTDLLLDAFERLDDPSLELRLGGPTLGGESEREWRRGVIERAERHPRVSYVGEVRDIPAFFQPLDLFVLPSRSEGMSNSLLEAMAAGIPIVATRVGSNPEVLGDGAAGVLVEPDADAIASGIRLLLDDPKLAGELAARARARAESEYGFSAMVARYERLYESLVRGASADRPASLADTSAGL
jgi:glycosyltransferase involved in cell wall biosynthesis